jgi:hypothetical protein
VAFPPAEGVAGVARDAAIIVVARAIPARASHPLLSGVTEALRKLKTVVLGNLADGKPLLQRVDVDRMPAGDFRRHATRK